MLVEAGAGSGKTTELVNRMLALVSAGQGVERIAAVTFTRKAAGELAQRFRNGLEDAFHEARRSDPSTAARFDRALQVVDRIFIGTIHAFCARLLREQPLEAGIDPKFTELGEAETTLLAEEYWTWHLDERHARHDPILVRLGELGIDPHELRFPFTESLDDSDVAFPVQSVPEPDVTAAREELLELMDRAEELLRAKPQGTLSDNLQKTVYRLRFHHRSTGWRSPRDFFRGLEALSQHACKVTQYMWTDDPTGKKKAGTLGKEFRAFHANRAGPLMQEWYAYRYGAVQEFLDPLLRDFQDYRRRTGQLTFHDLLQFTAVLLRSNPEVRRRIGERYRYLLVDEFQDTDPLQAEVCLLLASDPAEGDDWLTVCPRPGALFVVGDPKQSIYRFRRADIEVYDLVYDRMKAFGEVVELTANFRSDGAIGRFVNVAFRDLFEERRTPVQAAFALMETRPRKAAAGRVYRYEIVPPGKENMDRLAQHDAERVASWIASRIDQGQRRPGDFLILPFRKLAVVAYARELEKRGIPVTTAGAGLTVERELRELLVLLEALADPRDPIATLAALEGLFFGLGPEELWEHRLAARPFSFERGTFDLDSPVERALAMMQAWARLSEDLPTDAAIARIVEEVGLLPIAVAGEMAESRAGSLAHALDIVGAGALRGAVNLRSAIEVIESTMDATEIEAPLRPGRVDAVRVMNLHKAKGLEAPIVVLPHPTGAEGGTISKHVRRTDEGAAEGFRRIGSRDRTIAEPPDWSMWEERERTFQTAEGRRLLYVAVTRAKEELLVAECSATHDKSPWRELHDALLAEAAPLELNVVPPRPRPEPSLTVEDVTIRLNEAIHARQEAARPGYRKDRVTEGLVEEGEEEEFEFRGGPGGRGREWGTLVHRAIAAMGRGRTGDGLRAYCRALLLDAGRPLDATGVPLELEGLLGLLTNVRQSPGWLAIAGACETRWELPVARLETSSDDLPVLITGTIDAVGIGSEGEPWHVVDWKTDLVEGEEWNAREARYRQQVEKYAEILGGLAGVQVRGQLSRLR